VKEVFWWKCRNEESHLKSQLTCKCNNKIVPKELVWEYVDWIHLGQVRIGAVAYSCDDCMGFNKKEEIIPEVFKLLLSSEERICTM
jgi:hypothetical protein